MLNEPAHRGGFFCLANNAMNRTIHKSKGQSIGIGICTYFAILFQVNEITSKQRTDEEIAMEVEKEFPNRPTAFCFREPHKTRSVNEYRHRYNTGKFTNGRIPELYSFRYNSNKERVEASKGQRPLTDEEITTQLAEHEAKRNSQKEEDIKYWLKRGVCKKGSQSTS